MTTRASGRRSLDALIREWRRLAEQANVNYDAWVARHGDSRASIAGFRDSPSSRKLVSRVDDVMAQIFSRPGGEEALVATLLDFSPPTPRVRRPATPRRRRR